MGLRDGICTGLGLLSPFLTSGWGAPEVILGSSGWQVLRTVGAGIRQGDTQCP